ncbi:MAG: molybdopterin-dependent oxidoreductase [Chloroflexota bacterium]
MPARSRGAWDGLLATVAGCSVAFVTGLATNRPFVANAIADRIMEATPVGIASVLLTTLGVAAKPFALAGSLALAGALGAASGTILGTPSPVATGEGWGEGIHPSRRRILVLAIVQAGVVAWLAHPQTVTAVVLPYAVWAFVMAALMAEPEPSGERRWFLERSFQAAAGLVLLSSAATWTLLAKTLAGAQPGRLLFLFQPPAPRQPEFMAVEGRTPEVTAVTRFYLMSKTVENPAVAVDSWRLRISGLVSSPLELTYDDLLLLPRTDQWLTLRCVSNPVGGPLISNALWSGVPLSSLLSLAGVVPEATTLVLKARDTYSDSFPLNRALLDTTMLAYAVNGGFLNRDHGFPARVLVPGLYGFKNVIWVDELQLLAGDFSGPWQRLGWTKTAIQTTFSRIDFVRRSASGALAGGIAFAGDRGIRSVEVRAGDQPWREAQLHTPTLGNLTWVQWLFPFDASGRTAVTVRATDDTGALQEHTERGIFPNGATGWHTVTAEL